MYVCLMERQGKKLVHTNVKNNFSFFLKLIEPYKHSLTVCCECMLGRCRLKSLDSQIIVSLPTAVDTPIRRRHH